MRRYSSGKSPNLTWQMEANLGQNFEDFVAKIIMAQLRQLHPQVQVFQTADNFSRYSSLTTGASNI